MDNLGQASQGNTPEPLLPAVAPQDLAQKCMTAINGSLTCLCMTLGHKLGLYATLKSLGQSSSSGLAAAAGLSERWVREWLYQQAAAGFISTDPRAATYWLNDVQTDLLVEAASLKEAKESPLGESCQSSDMLYLPASFSAHLRQQQRVEWQSVPF